MNRQSKTVTPLPRTPEKPKQWDNTIVETFPGFSKRLDQLIDLVELDIPQMDDGRQAYIADVLSSSRMASGEWLKKDKPPKTATLRKLVNFLISHMSVVHNPFKIEAWLKYGDDVVTSPFGESPQDNPALIPLATSLIVSIAKEIEIPANELDLSKVLSATVEILSEFKLTHDSEVEPVHRRIIAQYIKANPRFKDN